MEIKLKDLMRVLDSKMLVILNQDEECVAENSFTCDASKLDWLDESVLNLTVVNITGGKGNSIFIVLKGEE